MKQFGFVVLLLSITMLGACGTIHPVDFLPKEVPSTSKPLTDAALTEIVVTKGSESVLGVFEPESFRIALEQVLRRSNLFGEQKSTNLRLFARVSRFTVSGIANVNVEFNVQYKLIVVMDNVLYAGEINSSGHAMLSDAFSGANRMHTAWVRTRESHMNKLVESLKKALNESANKGTLPFS